ncbi:MULTISPECIES: Lpg1974 family pore-forming outer membrane protein [unclassified Legionella]|uniref:Lpg1974 family pore-forming outer membrane protein n=1 Tax=unclassified Legionella TaxID=2622702 RepID=UPI001056ADC6|nr:MULTISPECIES: Lpg1974 family pore-forming outer membrane protein [unclassified Legionella]MDI9819634.1 Lpg1974 family pore-forming outer membrane protein [Legionella sp. PL877]
MLKKTTLAVLGLAASGFVSAGMYSPPPAPSCAPGDVTVPCEAKRWDIGVQALYLKPTYDADRGYEFTPAGTLREANDDWSWGYRLEGSYHFNTGNDVTMTWMHFDNDSTQSGFAGLTPFSGASFVPFNLSLDTRFDQVNLVMGQHVDIGLLKDARFYGGLQYTRIRVDARNRYLATPVAIAPVAPGGFVLNRNVDFNGLGPVIGVDYAYNLTHGFSLTANLAGSILYGSSRYNSAFAFSPSGLVPAGVYASRKSIVPGVEAKLGLNYAHELAQGTFNIEGGYQVVNYFNALETRGVTGFGVAGDSDFGLYGPYIGVKWVGNV